MTDQATLTGGCLCGEVRYRATARAERVAICYCRDCTRAVGSAVTVWALFSATDFEFTGRDPIRYESSPGVTRTFCGRCGTSLTYHYPNGRKIDLATASLDDPGALVPTEEGGTRPEWVGTLARHLLHRDER